MKCMKRKDKKMSDILKEDCRWYDNGWCTIGECECLGYDIYDCGIAEDLDDLNSDYSEGEF